jgi:two-component system response regulator MprA
MSGCDDVRVTAADAPRILVVDDDPRLAASVRRALAYEGYRVETASDGPGALAAARDYLPDLVVLDVMLPGVDGIEVCRRLRAASDVPILMLTARDAIDARVDGLDSGADDYLVKPFAYEELMARVRSLLRRRAPGATERLTIADLVLEPDAREARRGDRRLELTALEFSLLEHFARHPRVVLTRERILEAVWGFEAESVSNVVDVYVGYLRRELEAGGEPRLLQTVRGVGYVLRGEA